MPAVTMEPADPGDKGDLDEGCWELVKDAVRASAEAADGSVDAKSDSQRTANGAS